MDCRNLGTYHIAAVAVAGNMHCVIVDIHCVVGFFVGVVGLRL